MYTFRLPQDFLIGTAHSAFQSEGAWDRDGKSMSMMDHYARQFAGKPFPAPPMAAKKAKARLITTDLPNDGCFFYDNYEAYIEDMVKTGQNTFRLSLSWPRIIPTGYGEVNPKGIEYYNKVIDLLIAKGIEPLVDLNHWDLPQCLQDEDGGFRSKKFPEWFEAFAKVCFEAFGDRVKFWSTFNESSVMINTGYCVGRFPPFEASWEGSRLAAHNLMIAHFRAVRLFRQMGLEGKIGAVHAISPVYPADPMGADIGAANRQNQFKFDWYMQPMAEGKYPEELIEACPEIKAAMPENYQEDLDKWFTPMDFVGLNYYYTKRSDYQPDNVLKGRFAEDFYSQPGAKYNPYPAGLMDAVTYVWERYKLPIYITENGIGMEDTHDEEQDCNDDDRITCLREHLRMIVRAIRVGIPVLGYYYWDDADCYEILTGNSHRFGLTWVDHETGRRRWKKSRYYFQKICQTMTVD